MEKLVRTRNFATVVYPESAYFKEAMCTSIYISVT